MVAELWLAEVPYDYVPEAMVGVLSAAEQEQADAYYRAADRASYVAAHVALRQLLGARLGLPPTEVGLRNLPCPGCGQAHGRPALAGQSGRTLHFSLSRSGRLTMVGLCPVTIGVDVEAHLEGDQADGVIASLHPGEQAELGRCPAGQRGRLFTELWARKEAYLKGLGIGLGRNLALDYLGPDLTQRPEGWIVANVEAGPDHAAAYAVNSCKAATRLTWGLPGFGY